MTTTIRTPLRAVGDQKSSLRNWRFRIGKERACHNLTGGYRNAAIALVGHAESGLIGEIYPSDQTSAKKAVCSQSAVTGALGVLRLFGLVYWRHKGHWVGSRWLRQCNQKFLHIQNEPFQIGAKLRVPLKRTREKV